MSQWGVKVYCIFLCILMFNKIFFCFYLVQFGIFCVVVYLLFYLIYYCIKGIVLILQYVEYFLYWINVEIKYSRKLIKFGY